MSLFQCSCGMFVSSPEARTRCLRCGRILGADEELHDLFGEVAVLPTGATVRPELETLAPHESQEL